jgi:hypothetical protein
MNEIDRFKVFVFYNGDVTADVDQLYVKRIYLVSFSYIVIEDRGFTNFFEKSHIFF